MSLFSPPQGLSKLSEFLSSFESSCEMDLNIYAPSSIEQTFPSFSSFSLYLWSMEASSRDGGTELMPREGVSTPTCFSLRGWGRARERQIVANELGKWAWRWVTALEKTTEESFGLTSLREVNSEDFFFNTVHGKVALARSWGTDAGEHCHTLMPSCC